MSRPKHDAGFMIADDSPASCEKNHARIEVLRKRSAESPNPRTRASRYECGCCHLIFEPIDMARSNHNEY